MASLAELNQDQTPGDEPKKLTGSLFKKSESDAPFIIERSSFLKFEKTLFASLNQLSDIRNKIENFERDRDAEQNEIAKETKQTTETGAPVREGKEEEQDESGGMLGSFLNAILGFVKYFSKMILGVVSGFFNILKDLLLSKLIRVLMRGAISALGAILGKAGTLISLLLKRPIAIVGMGLGAAILYLNKKLNERIEEAGGEEELIKEADIRSQEAGTDITPLTPETAPEPTGRSARELAAGRLKESQIQQQSDKMVIGQPAAPKQPQPAAGTPTPVAEPSAAPAPAPGTPQKEDFTMKEEGFSPNLYKDAGGYSIGYGHHLTPTELASKKIILNDGTEIDLNKGITKDQAKKLYDQDKQGHTKGAIEQLKKLGVDTSKLNPETINALSDLAYNAGPGIFNKAPRLVAALKENNLEKIAAELKTTATTSEGKQLTALKSRAEKRANMVLASAAPPTAETAEIAMAGDVSPEARVAKGGQVYIQPIVVEHKLKAA